MAKKDPKADTRKYKKEERDDTVATLDTSEEAARLNADLDEDRLVGRPDAAERLDVFREGDLEGLQKEAEKFGPDGIGQIKDNLGNDIARHDGPGIADMFKSGSKYGLTGTDKTDPLSGQPQIPDDDGAPDTPFRKNDPSLASSSDGGSWREKYGEQLGETMGGGSGGGAPDGGTPAPGGGAGGGPPGGGTEGSQEELAVRELMGKAAAGLRQAGIHGEASKLEARANPALAKEAAEKQAKEKAEREAKEKAEREAKEKAEREAKEKAEKNAKEKADKEAKEKKAKEKEKKTEKDGDNEEDEATTYTTGDVEWTPSVNTLESGPLLTDHDLLGHRVDPGDGQFEIDGTQVNEVVTTGPSPTQILTSAEELPATVDLSTPPTVPGSELENTGNPLDAEAPPVPPGGSTTGPPSGGGGGGGETGFEAPTAELDTAALDTAAVPAGAAAVPGGNDFAGPPAGAEHAAPVPGGADLGDDPDDDGVPGPG